MWFFDAFPLCKQITLITVHTSPQRHTGNSSFLSRQTTHKHSFPYLYVKFSFIFNSISLEIKTDDSFFARCTSQQQTASIWWVQPAARQNHFHIDNSIRWLCWNGWNVSMICHTKSKCIAQNQHILVVWLKIHMANDHLVGYNTRKMCKFATK